MPEGEFLIGIGVGVAPALIIFARAASDIHKNWRGR